MGRHLDHGGSYARFRKIHRSFKELFFYNYEFIYIRTVLASRIFFQIESVPLRILAISLRPFVHDLNYTSWLVRLELILTSLVIVPFLVFKNVYFQWNVSASVLMFLFACLLLFGLGDSFLIPGVNSITFMFHRSHMVRDQCICFENISKLTSSKTVLESTCITALIIRSILIYFWKKNKLTTSVYHTLRSCGIYKQNLWSLNLCKSYSSR